MSLNADIEDKLSSQLVLNQILIDKLVEMGVDVKRLV